MTIEDLSQYLCCPCEDRGPLALVSPEAFACTRCNRSFPIWNGRPVLLNESRSLFSAAEVLSHTDRRLFSEIKGIKYLFRKLFPAGSWQEKTAGLKKYVGGLPENPVVLVIGCGFTGRSFREMLPNARLILSDVTLQGDADIVCGGERLPLFADSVDLVIIDQVLEHTLDPSEVVEEIYRCLKPGGTVFSGIPFFYPNHGFPFDFQRFTPLGHRLLYRKFRQLELRLTGGPFSALSLALIAFFQSLWKNLYWSRVTSFFTRLCFRPLIALDRFYAGDRLTQTTIAINSVFVGVKDPSPPSPRSILAPYRDEPKRLSPSRECAPRAARSEVAEPADGTKTQDGEESPASSERIGVAHLIDSLSIGGAERVAVNLANLLPTDRYSTYLCATREEGPLSKLVAPHVSLVTLHRTGRIGFAALRRFIALIHARRIRILHAHGTSLFFGRLAGWLSGVPVVWHDHYGRCELDDRPVWSYRLAARNIGGVIAVNRPLVEWSRRRLGIPAGRVRYIPNLIEFAQSTPGPESLPGNPGRRIVCVANFRPQKDHVTLLRAMSIVRRFAPCPHLLLVGDTADSPYLNLVRKTSSDLGLDDVVSFLGQREDVPAILRACDIGVLSSVSEGLPLALLEYGKAGLAPVVTNVGQCREVIDNGRVGICVPPSQPERLAEALTLLLNSTSRRLTLGQMFQERVETVDRKSVV